MPPCRSEKILAGLMSRALSGAQGGRVKHALSGVWRKAGRSGINKAAQWDRMMERERRVCACVRVCEQKRES